MSLKMGRTVGDQHGARQATHCFYSSQLPQLHHSTISVCVALTTLHASGGDIDPYYMHDPPKKLSA